MRVVANFNVYDSFMLARIPVRVTILAVSPVRFTQVKRRYTC